MTMMTNMAMLGILLGFTFLVVGFLMEGPKVETVGKSKKMHKKVKKNVVKLRPVLKRAA
jgi:hypothetical protein